MIILTPSSQNKILSSQSHEFSRPKENFARNASSSVVRSNFIITIDKIAGGKIFGKPTVFARSLSSSSARVYRESSMNQTEEDRYVAKCFSDDCLALKRVPPTSPSVLRAYSCHPASRKVAYESLHLCPLTEQAFKPEAFSFSYVFVQIWYRNVFVQTTRGDRGGKVKGRRIEITTIFSHVFNVFLYFLL